MPTSGKRIVYEGAERGDSTLPKRDEPCGEWSITSGMHGFKVLMQLIFTLPGSDVHAEGARGSGVVVWTVVRESIEKMTHVHGRRRYSRSAR